MNTKHDGTIAGMERLIAEQAARIAALEAEKRVSRQHGGCHEELMAMTARAAEAEAERDTALARVAEQAARIEALEAECTGHVEEFRHNVIASTFERQRDQAASERGAFKAERDALAKDYAALRGKVRSYLEASKGEDCSSASWDAWEEMREEVDGHASHGRGNLEDGPDDSDCPCRSTGREGSCAASGCGFCRASTLSTEHPGADFVPRAELDAAQDRFGKGAYDAIVTQLRKAQSALDAATKRADEAAAEVERLMAENLVATDQATQARASNIEARAALKEACGLLRHYGARNWLVAAFLAKHDAGGGG